MIFKSANILLVGLKQLYCYNPVEFVSIFCLMLLQKATAGIGLLLILPLLQLMGLESTGADDRVTRILVSVASLLGIEPNFVSIISLFFGLMLLATFVDYVLEVKGAKLRHFYIHHLRSTVYRLVLYSQWSYLQKKRLTEINHILATQIRSMSVTTNLMLICLASSVSLFVLTLLSFFISWSMTLFTIATGIFFVVCLWPYFRQSHDAGKKELSSYQEVFNGLSEQLRFLKMIKSHQYEEIFFTDIKNSSEKLERQSVVAVTILGRTKGFYKMGAAFFFVFVLSVSQFWLKIPLDQLLLLLIIYARILPQLSALNDSAQQLVRTMPVYFDIQRLQHECCQAQEKRQMIAPIAFEHAIKLKNVSFRYANSGPNILSKVNLTLKKGQILLLSGESGIGKSTLVDIMAGLLAASDGQFYVDNTLITMDNMGQWRHNISYISQDTYLLNDTISRNLNPNDELLEDDRLWHALELAAAAEFVRALPQKLDTVIGGQGVLLSGGQRQRIALARSFLRQAPLTILDEATNGLDVQTEQKVHDSLMQLRGKQTLIIISHRPSDTVPADFVLRLQ